MGWNHRTETKELVTFVKKVAIDRYSLQIIITVGEGVPTGEVNQFNYPVYTLYQEKEYSLSIADAIGKYGIESTLILGLDEQLETSAQKVVEAMMLESLPVVR